MSGGDSFLRTFENTFPSESPIVGLPSRIFINCRSGLSMSRTFPLASGIKTFPHLRLAGRGNLILTFLTLNQIPYGAKVID
jgi:hypothetical protein